MEPLHHTMAESRTHPISVSRILRWLASGCAIVFIVPLLPVIVLGIFLYRATLACCPWIFWCPRGITTLLVYSRSPNWEDYIEQKILPRLPATTVVLNWSDRWQWPPVNLAVLVFRHFGGSTDFNPIVIVTRPFRMPRVFRFHRPFLDHKHGNSQTLYDLESELYCALGVPSAASPDDPRKS